MKKENPVDISCISISKNEVSERWLDTEVTGYTEEGKGKCFLKKINIRNLLYNKKNQLIQFNTSNNNSGSKKISKTTSIKGIN